MFQQITDSIITPLIEILAKARYRLETLSLVAARGLNLDYFLGPLSLLSPEWRVLIGSIIASSFLILGVLVARKTYGLYLAFKEGVKWW
jgi:hypothetical protein